MTELVPLRFLREESEAVVLGPATDVAELLHVVHEHLSGAGVRVYMEGMPDEDLREYLARHALRPLVAVPPTMIGRKVTCAHLAVHDLPGFVALATDRPAPQVADHVIVYQQDNTLLQAFDVGTEDAVWASPALPDATLERLRGSLPASDGPAARRALHLPSSRDSMRLLRRLDVAENVRWLISIAVGIVVAWVAPVSGLWALLIAILAAQVFDRLTVERVRRWKRREP